MKKLTLTLFLALIWSVGFTQSDIIGKLTKELSVTTDDKRKVLLLSDISYFMR